MAARNCRYPHATQDLAMLSTKFPDLVHSYLTQRCHHPPPDHEIFPAQVTNPTPTPIHPLDAVEPTTSLCAHNIPFSLLKLQPEISREKKTTRGDLEIGKSPPRQPKAALEPNIRLDLHQTRHTKFSWSKVEAAPENEAARLELVVEDREDNAGK
ncbi:hypothetical protein TIFTF001_048382 [Ficus carica]|uniref:Uncharacterized protein n=1 Tax=Ficus carica TaxID=3494 RepID=A0AA88CYK8_FICCA|nr:hypothetical protein TIFTF001_048382 [Ficus carica]